MLAWHYITILVLLVFSVAASAGIAGSLWFFHKIMEDESKPSAPDALGGVEKVNPLAAAASYWSLKAFYASLVWLVASATGLIIFVLCH